MEETITMTKKEASRYEILQKLINKKINGTEAAKTLGLTKRHVRRLKKIVKNKGIQGIIHKN